MFGKSLLKSATVSSLGVLAVGTAAQAALTVDLRFPTGPNSPTAHSYVIPSAGTLTPITIQAWAQVTGAATNGAEDGLQSVMLAVRSAITSAGITGSITSAQLASGWAGSGAQVGSASNLSADGIGDWGNSANNTIGSGITSFFRPRTTKSTNNAVDWGDGDSPVGSVNNPLADGGAEFLVGLFTFTPTAAPFGAVLQYAPVIPLGGTTNPLGWFEDTTDKTAVTPSGSKNSTNGTFGPATPNAGNVNAVTITVLPEPTSLGLAGLLGMGLLRRRRA